MNKTALKIDTFSLNVLQEQGFRDGSAGESISTPRFYKVSGGILYIWGRFFSAFNKEDVVKQLRKVATTENSDLLKNFDGDFLIVFVDRELSKIYLINDKNGKYRLYYSIEGRKLSISSHILLHASLMEYPAISNYGLFQYLTTTHILDPSTLLENVEVLQIGEYVIIETNQVKKHKYYEPVQIEAPEFKNARVCVQAMDESLKRVFDKRLIGGKQPLVLLSGGIDSVCMMYYVRETSGNPPSSLTFGLKNHMDKDDQEASRIVAKFFRGEHREIIIDPEKGWELFLKSLKQADTPLYAGIISQAVSDELNGRIALTIFAGQDTRLHTPFIDSSIRIGLKRNLLNRPLTLPEFITIQLLSVFKSWPYRGGGAIRNFLTHAAFYRDPTQYLLEIFFHYFNPLQYEGALLDKLKGELKEIEGDSLKNLFKKVISVMYRGQFTDNMNELRAPFEKGFIQIDWPFYDSDFVQICNNVPYNLAVKPIYTIKTQSLIPVVRKCILRLLMKDKIPESFLHRRKYAAFSLTDFISLDFFYKAQRVLNNELNNLVITLDEEMRLLVRWYSDRILAANRPADLDDEILKRLFILLYSIILSRVCVDKNMEFIRHIDNAEPMKETKF